MKDWMDNKIAWIVCGVAVAVVLIFGAIWFCIGGNDTIDQPNNPTTSQTDNTTKPNDTTNPTDPTQNNPYITEDEAPILRVPTSADDIDEDDTVITDENGKPKAIKDIEKYITYDYQSLVDKTSKTVNSEKINDMLTNTDDYKKRIISQEVLDAYEKYYNSLPEDQREGMTLEQAMEEYLFDNETLDLGISKEIYDDTYMSLDKAFYVSHETDANRLFISLYKDCFKDYEDFYQITYELFVELMEKFDNETIKNSLLIKKEYTTYSSLKAKVDERDYAYLYNAFMNDCCSFMYTGEGIEVSFGRDEMIAEDWEHHRGFFVMIHITF